MLKLQVKDSTSREPIWLVDPILSIGKNTANDLVVDSEGIKDFHAQIILKNNKVYLKDITGNNGCLVNSEFIQEQELKAGDQIKLQNIEMNVLDGKQAYQDQMAEKGATEDCWSLVSNNSWLEGQSFQIHGSTVIGRGVNCEITIPGTHLSRQHCELTVKDSRLLIEDLGSSNGTFLNEKKITKAEAQSGDVLRIDVYSFDITGPEQDDSDKTMIRMMPNELTADGKISSSQQKSTPKTQPHQAKEWKHKSTSPGNREEEPASSSSNTFVYGLLVAAVAAVVAFMLLT